MIECFVPSAGAQLFCRVRGEGKPLLLIHGAVCDSDFFEDAASALASEFCVVTYDRRGYSRSSGQLDESFLSASAKDAEQICRQLFPAVSVSVVGCSAGGLIAMEFARRCPELVKQLVLHEPPLPAFLPPCMEAQSTVRQIQNFLAQKKYIRAANRFLGLLEDADPSARPKPQEICEREERNLEFFIRNEFLPAFSSLPPAALPASVFVTVGAGRGHQKHYLFQAAKTYADKCNYPFRLFPGRHNCAWDRPLDFAKTVKEILAGPVKSPQLPI